MIYLFHGSDVEKTRTKAFEWVAKARAKEPNLAYVRLAREELTLAALEDAALSGGLFVQRLLILLDDPFRCHTRYARNKMQKLARTKRLQVDWLRIISMNLPHRTTR